MDILRSFEEMLRQTAPVLLAVPGVILVISGLFLWLGGLRLLRPLAAFFAAAAGFVCAMTLTSRELFAVVGFTVIPAAIALFIEKPMVVLLGACLAGAAVLAFPVVADGAFREAVIDQTGPVPVVEDASMFETEEYAKALSEWAGQWCRNCWEAMSDGRKAAAAGVMAGTLILGVVACRWVCALICATLGTGMMLSGLTVLVLSKGPQTIPYLADKRSYLWIAVGGMIAAGTLLNRLLCPAKTNRKKPKESQVQGDGK